MSMFSTFRPLALALPMGLCIAFFGMMTVQPSLASAAQIGGNETWIAKAAAAFSGLSAGKAHALRELSRLKVGQRGSVPLAGLILGQDEISIDNIKQKYEDRLGAGDFSVDPSSDAFRLAYDHGRSVVPPSDPISVVKGPSGAVIVDGNHDFILSLNVGAQTIPVEVIEDLSHLTEREFWAEMKLRRRVLFRKTARQLAKQPPVIQDLVDVPLRFLAGLIAAKVETRIAGHGRRIISVKTPKLISSIWIKENASLPFIEFTIAKVLRAAGLRYDPAWGTNIPSPMIEMARAVLLQAQAMGRVEDLQAVVILTKEDSDQLADDPKTEVLNLLSLRERKARQFSCQKLFK